MGSTPATALDCRMLHEWTFVSARSSADPFNEIEVSVLFRHEDGGSWLVPAFWAGGDLWRVRFAPERPGKHSFESVCSDQGNGGLHALEGGFQAVACRGDSPLLSQGPVRVSEDRRTLEHVGGAPFLWLADTWWMGLCGRLDWPRGFQALALDRAEKGFNVIQIVAGPYPDMTAFDARAANEAGFSWETGFSRINPRYYDLADRRIEYLVSVGLVPCIVGCWGYHLLEMGVQRVKRHWRNLIARYGAFPVVWCLAGEACMPFYMSETKEEDTERLRSGWTEVASYVRETDPCRRLLTIHPRSQGREEIADPSLLDFEMLQTGHGDRDSLGPTVRTLSACVRRSPRMPVIDAEVCYEGIGEACREEVQRLMFWTCILNGAAGHTYGANGLWQFNTPGAPYGPSPHGLAWGGPDWQTAMALPGSRQLGLAKRLLERYPWWDMEPHPEWVQVPENPAIVMRPYAAGIPSELRIIFWPSAFGAGAVLDIEPGVRYRAFLFSPVDGHEVALGAVSADSSGRWVIPTGNPPWQVMPIFQDWVLVMESDK